MRMWFDVVTRRDARLLVEWWNGHTTGRFFARKSPTNRRLWCVLRQI